MNTPTKLEVGMRFKLASGVAECQILFIGAPPLNVVLIWQVNSPWTSQCSPDIILNLFKDGIYEILPPVNDDPMVLHTKITTLENELGAWRTMPIATLHGGVAPDQVSVEWEPANIKANRCSTGQ